MQEFQKVACLYHPSEFITNFCKEKSCLMPLCPTCICSHLELHLKGGKSNPQFDNINDSLGAISQEIKVFSDKFEEGRSKLNTIQRTISEQKKDLAQLIYKSKVQVRQLVEAVFQEVEKDLEASIEKQNHQLGLHLPESLDSLQKGILDIGSKLREMNSDLRTDRSLSTLITFNHETRASLEKYQSDVFKEIRNNQEYSPVSNINSEALNHIKHALSQIITLKFNYPQVIRQQQAIHQAKLSSKIRPQQPEPHQHKVLHQPHSHQTNQTHQAHQPTHHKTEHNQTHHQTTQHTHQPTHQQSHQTLQHPHTHHNVNPPKSSGTTGSEKVALASSLGARPTVITSPTKASFGQSTSSKNVTQHQPSSQNSAIKRTEAPGATTQPK